jgi:nicotinamidase-related amidase
MSSKPFQPGSTSPLDELLAELPRDDLAALTKYWEGKLPAPWGLGQRPAVIVVDMTRGFVEDEFPMGWFKTGGPCQESIAKLLTVVRRKGLPTFFSKGFVPSLEAERGAWLRGGHKPKGADPREHDIVDLLAPAQGEGVVVKAKPSAFFGSQLNSMLNYSSVDTVIITGMTTSGCVRATVNDAFALNYRVVIPVECVADRSQLSHRVELIDMGVKYADLVRLDDLLAQLNEIGG